MNKIKNGFEVLLVFLIQAGAAIIGGTITIGILVGLVLLLKSCEI